MSTALAHDIDYLGCVLILNYSRLHNRRVSAILIIILLICIAFYLQAIFAPKPVEVEWGDDFNDGNYENWTIEGGHFEIVNNSLTLLGISRISTVFHESVGAFGNWSFDLNGGSPTVWFIASSPHPGNVSGYKFAKGLDEESEFFNLYRVLDGQETRIAHFVMDGRDDSITTLRKWHHIDVMRDMNGLITINLNGSEIITTVDANITTSNYFVFGAISPGARIDNINVNAIMMPPSIELGPLEYGIAAAILVTCAVLVLEMRRRRR